MKKTNNAIPLSRQELPITPSLYSEMIFKEKKLSITLLCRRNLLPGNKMAQGGEGKLFFTEKYS